jgi:hypothetical protein
MSKKAMPNCQPVFNLYLVNVYALPGGFKQNITFDIIDPNNPSLSAIPASMQEVKNWRSPSICHFIRFGDRLYSIPFLEIQTLPGRRTNSRACHKWIMKLSGRSSDGGSRTGSGEAVIAERSHELSERRDRVRTKMAMAPILTPDSWTNY